MKTAEDFFTQKNGGKTAEELLSEGVLISPILAVRLMEQYHEARMKEELIDFMKYAKLMIVFLDYIKIQTENLPVGMAYGPNGPFSSIPEMGEIKQAFTEELNAVVDKYLATAEKWRGEYITKYNIEEIEEE